MDDAFARAMTEWSGFYTLLGGATATLLGLLFVALSLRLNIFHERDLADVRDFATFTFSTFLVAIVIAALAVAPHERGGALAVALLFAATAGLLMTAWVARAWIRLNLSTTESQAGPESGPGIGPQTGLTLRPGQGITYMVGMGTPYLGVLAAAGLVWMGHPHALGWLAISEGWLVVMGTVAAWVMLSHARGAEGSDSAAS